MINNKLSNYPRVRFLIYDATVAYEQRKKLLVISFEVRRSSLWMFIGYFRPQDIWIEYAAGESGHHPVLVNLKTGIVVIKYVSETLDQLFKVWPIWRRIMLPSMYDSLTGMSFLLFLERVIHSTIQQTYFFTIHFVSSVEIIQLLLLTI